MTNTRFNPTANGNLHIGHLYLILLNYHAAKRNNGKFIVRFDDDQALWIQRLGREKIDQFCEEIKEDLSWMGIEPDLYSYESKEKEENEKYLKQIKMLDDTIPTFDSYKESLKKIQIKNTDRPYPYVPHLTAIKVVQDRREDCGILIRGEDLVSEFSLYCYFCKLLGFPIPDFFYVPKLMQSKKGGGSLLDLSDVSKTAGSLSLRELKQKGYSPRQIIELLEDVCFIDKEKGWSYENIKQDPVIYL